MTRASFTSLKLTDPDVFAVKVAGHLGAKERAKVEELLRQCRERAKTRVVLELSELESMGGGVASVLGEFAGEMAGSNRLLLFVAGSDVVRGFMTARFTGAPPEFADTLDQAQEICARHVARGAGAAKSAGAGAARPSAPGAAAGAAGNQPHPHPVASGSGIRAEARSQGRSDARSEAKPRGDVKSDSRGVPKVDVRANGRADARAPGRVDVRSDAKGSPRGEAKSDAKPDAKRDAKGDSKGAARVGGRERGNERPSDRANDRAAARDKAGAERGDKGNNAPKTVILLPDANDSASNVQGLPARSKPGAPSGSSSSLAAMGAGLAHGPAGAAGAVPAGRYISVDEGLRLCRDAGQLAAASEVIANMLHGAGLAQACVMFVRDGDRVVEVNDRKLSLPVDGPLGRVVSMQNTPVTIVDVCGHDLGVADGDLLTTLNCQIAVPVNVKGTLEGVLFLRKELAGSEYGPSEILALDLLARRIGDMIGGGDLDSAAAVAAVRAAAPTREGRGAKDESEAQLKRKVYQQKALLGISRDFNSTQDEEHLINLLLLTAIGQVGSGAVAYFELDEKGLCPRAHRGLENVELPRLTAPGSAALAEWTEPASAACPPPAARELMKKLTPLGLQVAAPVRSKQRMFGILALGPKLSGALADYDAEFLSILLNQTGIALENARLFRELEDRTLGVARTFVSLIEKRNGEADRASTELITYYVGQVAQALAFPTEKYRDLLYGTVLRDIGMIEISDLVLRSPRSLTNEEWRLIKQHPSSGMTILGSMGFNDDITGIVLHHHERFNGEGYPHGLRGAAIPVGSRIVAVAESFVAMTRNLPYRAALGWGEALEVMRENWGLRYDPAVLEAFLAIVMAEGERKAKPQPVMQGS